jgi:multidrug resistance efflux pump
VHKGDLLLAIDPTNYEIAVRLAEAAVHQAQSDVHRTSRRRSPCSKRKSARTMPGWNKHRRR